MELKQRVKSNTMNQQNQKLFFYQNKFGTFLVRPTKKNQEGNLNC